MEEKQKALRLSDWYKVFEKFVEPEYLCQASWATFVRDSYEQGEISYRSYKRYLAHNKYQG